MKLILLSMLALFASCGTSKIAVQGCSTSNKIAVKHNKYGPLHMEKYTEVNGNYYVHGRLVKLIPNTKVYASQ